MALVFIPSGLNIDTHLRGNPQSIKEFKKDKLYFIINLLTEIPAKSKKITESLDQNLGYVPINSEYLRSSGRIKNRNSYMEKSFTLIKNCEDKTVVDTLKEALLNLTIEPHLSNTLRKMGQGQKCSLRFFPEGEILRPTALDVSPSFSQSRLGNVLGMFSDLGFCEKDRSGKYKTTEKGKSILSDGEHD